MANAGSDRFCGSLFAAVGGRVAADTKLLYKAKLAKWYLSDEQWAKALSRIVSELKSTDRGDVMLPALGDIYGYLKAVKAEDKPISEGCWQTWDDERGRRVARRISDPAHAPEIPPEATNGHIVIPEDMIAHGSYDPCDLIEGRLAFSEGFIEEGGTMAQLDAMFISLAAARQRAEEADVDEVPF